MQIIVLSGQQNFLQQEELSKSPLKALIQGKAELRRSQAALMCSVGAAAFKLHLRWKQGFGERRLVVKYSLVLAVEGK